MAMRSIIVRAPFCLNCFRRTIADDISLASFPSYRQLRGKKKTAKRATTINVRLLEDIPGYGRKGSITPVEPGRMRNTWYPRQKAQYMTAATESGVKPQKLTAERDFTFGLKPKEEEAPKVVEQQKQVDVQTKLLSPQRATEILEMALPSHVIFYRTPIPEPEPEPEPTPKESPSRRRGASSAAAELDLASDPLPKPPKSQAAMIFGSVSTADIAESIKAVLGQTKDGARVVVAAEDITFSEEDVQQSKTIEGDRLKALGDFRIGIRVKGGDSVVRTVSVKPQDTITESGNP